jgi:hypothetical protein
MKPNTGYDAVVHTLCNVEPPAFGDNGLLRGIDSNNATFRVEPHREYAAQCAKTGAFSTLKDTRCIPCPTEAEGATCIEGLLQIRDGYWMPDVTLARAIDTRDSMQTLLWKCKMAKACRSINAQIDAGSTAVSRSICGTGFAGNICRVLR